MNELNEASSLFRLDGRVAVVTGAARTFWVANTAWRWPMPVRMWWSPT